MCKKISKKTFSRGVYSSDLLSENICVVLLFACHVDWTVLREAQRRFYFFVQIPHAKLP